MTDIVERLRCGVDTNEPPDKTDQLMAAAADEIERLRLAVQHEADCCEAAKEEIERLRAEVTEWADETDWLRAEIERLRALLRELIEGPQPGTAAWAEKVRAALADQ